MAGEGATLFSALLAAPAFLGWASGSWIGGRRARILSARLPIIGWTLHLIHQLGEPRSIDYGPDPTNEVKVWLAGSLISGGVGYLMARRFDKNRT